jgi:hypothetical protein
LIEGRAIDKCELLRFPCHKHSTSRYPEIKRSRNEEVWGHRAFKGMLNKEILLIQKNDLNKYYWRL